MDLATLFVRFKADTTDINSKVKQLESNTKKSGDNIAKTLASAFSAAVIGAAIKGSIDKASDLNETVSKSKTIFGDASGALEKVAETASRTMGLSKQAYLDAASGLKGLLDNLGLTSEESVKWSQDLVKLGTDLGSFFNKDPAEAIGAIQSALRGESEPIRAFNVNLNDTAVKAKAMELGLYDGVGAIDASARATAAMKLIVEQTDKAQGDFTRTADGLANSQKTAKADADNAAASFGQVLLPAYTQIVQIVGGVVKVFGELPGPVQTAIVALLGIVALSGPISSFVSIVGSIKDAVLGLSASTGGLLLLGAAIAGLALIMSNSDDPHEQVAARAQEVAGHLKTETEEIIRQRQESGTATTATQAYADAQLALSKSLTGSDEKGQKLARALGALGLQAGDASKLVGLLRVESGDMTASQVTLTSATKAGGDASVLAAVRQRDLAVAMLEQQGIAHDVALVLVEAGQGATYMGDAADATKDKTKGWTEENKALLQAMIEVGKQAGNSDLALISTDYLNAEVATSKFRAELVAQAEAQVGATRAGDDAVLVYDAYLGLLENLTPAQLEAGDAAKTAAQGTDQLTVATDLAADATERYKVEQDQAEARSKADVTATEKLAKALGGTATKADLARKAADEFGKALDEVFGSSLDLESANRDLIAGFDELATAAKDNGTSLDINTDAGRKNRDMVQSQVGAILDQAKASIASGTSVADATAATGLYSQQLQKTLEDLGFNKDEAAAYIAQLGLTPENIATAVQLEHDEEVKARLQAMLDKLGDIDAGAAAEIKADIDQGKFDEAETLLNNLARDRGVKFDVTVTGKGAQLFFDKNGAVHSAAGNYFRGGRPTLSWVGDGSSDEVVLPLDNPARMRELASSNAVGSRILDALLGSGSSDEAAGSASMTSSSMQSTGASYSLTLQNYRSDVTVDDLSQLLGRLRLQMS